MAFSYSPLNFILTSLFPSSENTSQHSQKRFTSRKALRHCHLQSSHFLLALSFFGGDNIDFHRKNYNSPKKSAISLVDLFEMITFVVYY